MMNVEVTREGKQEEFVTSTSKLKQGKRKHERGEEEREIER